MKRTEFPFFRMLPEAENRDEAKKIQESPPTETMIPHLLRLIAL